MNITREPVTTKHITSPSHQSRQGLVPVCFAGELTPQLVKQCANYYHVSVRSLLAVTRALGKGLYDSLVTVTQWASGAEVPIRDLVQDILVSSSWAYRDADEYYSWILCSRTDQYRGKERV